MAVILIVEDETIIRELVEATIQSRGYQTLLASDVDEALVHLRSPQAIDALFTDIYLKTLYTTGNARSEKMNALFLEGAFCLRKPYTDKQLQHQLGDMVAA